MSIAYALRQATDEDAAFLYALNRETMREYVYQTWGDWQEAFQTQFFAEHFDSTANQMILVDGQPIGLLGVARSAERHFIRALQIATAWQGRGIGTHIVGELLAEARELNVPVELQVLKVNTGDRRLYARLGFRTTGESATHFHMRAP
jgi:RimJ/RimL family protein N-acetyltransferase